MNLHISFIRALWKKLKKNVFPDMIGYKTQIIGSVYVAKMDSVIYKCLKA